MAEIVGQGVIELELDSKKLSSGMDKATKIIESKVQSASVSMSQKFDRLGAELNKLSGIAKRAFAVIAGPATAIAVLAIRNALKQNTIETARWKLSMDRVNESLSDMGNKLLRVKIAGKDISSWLDAFSEQIISLNESDLSWWIKFAGIIAGIVASVTAIGSVTTAIGGIGKALTAIGSIGVGIGGVATGGTIVAGLALGVGIDYLYETYKKKVSRKNTWDQFSEFKKENEQSIKKYNERKEASALHNTESNKGIRSYGESLSNRIRFVKDILNSDNMNISRMELPDISRSLSGSQERISNINHSIDRTRVDSYAIDRLMKNTFSYALKEVTAQIKVATEKWTRTEFERRMGYISDYEASQKDVSTLKEINGLRKKQDLLNQGSTEGLTITEKTAYDQLKSLKEKNEDFIGNLKDILTNMINRNKDLNKELESRQDELLRDMYAVYDQRKGFERNMQGLYKDRDRMLRDQERARRGDITAVGTITSAEGLSDSIQQQIFGKASDDLRRQQAEENNTEALIDLNDTIIQTMNDQNDYMIRNETAINRLSETFITMFNWASGMATNAEIN